MSGNGQKNRRLCVGRGEGGGEAILEKRERRSFLFSLSGQKKSEYSYKVDK